MRKAARRAMAADGFNRGIERRGGGRLGFRLWLGWFVLY
jgi:hypothetical protein